MKSQRGTGPRITNKPFLLTFAVLLIFPSGFTQQTDDHYYVEPTPALRLPDEDLTTVLLVNNDNRTETHGRFLNVRPAVGLLTSTARTFIQEGVTTEYATQVLGTTLENGRLYAQLLKKSSRVLYDKDNIATSPSSGGTVHTSIVGETPHNHMFASPKLLLQSHNDLVADKDWQDVDDSLILEKNAFVVNTDYIATAPKASNIVYPIKASINENGMDYNENNGFLNRNLSINRSTSLNDAFRIKANKVRPSVDLPTFTVKNMFSPSGFSWESPIEIDEQQQKLDTFSVTTTSEPRSPKLLYHKIMKEERRPLSTVTYYGFADFTTIVGDSVIVFSPSTTTDKFAAGHVTSIKGEATLGHQEGSYVSNIAITITQDLIEPTFVVPMLSTNLNDLRIMPKDMREENKEEYTTLDMIDISDLNTQPKEETSNPTLQPTKTNEPYEVTLTTHTPNETTQSTQVEELSLDDEEATTIHSENLNEELITTTIAPMDDEEDFTSTTESEKDDDHLLLVSSMSDISFLASTQQPTPTETTSRVMLSRPSDEEILQIFSSLARAEAAEKASRIESQEETTTEHVTEAENSQEDEKILSIITTALREEIQPETKVEGGATTIFFEDDPFLDFISPNSVHLETSLWIQSSVVASVNSVVEQNKADEIGDVTVQPIVETESSSKSDITEQPETDIVNTTILSEDIVSDEEEMVQNSPTSTKPLNDSEMHFKPIIKEITENEEIEGCIRTSQVFLTQVPKTFTYYTTYLLSDEKEEDVKSTSIETNIVPSFDISEATKHYCIQPTQAVNTEYKSEEAVLERPTKVPEKTIIDKNIGNEHSAEEVIDTTPHIESEEPEKTDEAESTDMNYEDDEEEEEEDEDDQESGEEIELIYKTLYTTYTYLTTFFHDSTTSVSSRKEVVTNIITSSLDSESSTSMSYLDIKPTASITPDGGIASVINSEVHDTQGKFVVQSSDLIEIDGILRQDSENIRPTTQLNDDKLAKTYYTTYTYYTTIFVDGETEVMSRTEVHMNVVGTSSDVKINASPRNLNIDETIFEEDNAVIKIKPTATYDAITRTPISFTDIKNDSDAINNNLKYKTLGQGIKELESSSSSYSSRTEKKIVQLEDDLLRVRTDVQSSSSNGEHHIYENGVLEDQVSSESNRDEIIPSATLLLQTSFTTFTYYTTMYSSETTNIVSRLETITNIVTETLQPTKTLSIDEATLPITYFTTFTYWTKLAKDGEITTLSREETVSNIVTPSLSEPNFNSIEPTTALEQSKNTAESSDTSKIENTNLVEGTPQQSLAPTTYYTTYTYYTTSYAGDQTITDSRFETVTNVLTPTSITNISPTVILENIPSSENKEQVLDINSSNVETEKLDRTISYDYKTIVDADEISTLYFKTVVLATDIDGTSKEITSSTSAINVDEAKKATFSKSTSNPNDSTRNYKTGLVRLIEGTEFSNRTTTVYQSKVIGTIIDDRYAQIIESTSSFIIEKTPIPSLQSDAEIIASSTLLPTSVQPTELVASTSVNPLESSITEPTDDNEQDHEDEGEDEDENDETDEDGENDRKRTRLSFQTKKRTFTPVIRPFASRNRPQFAPKRKNLLQSSATIITRSDFTPTITATPAIKSDTRGRFTSSRKSNVAFTNTAGGSFSAGGKRFGRPSKTSQFGNFASSSSLSSSRNRLQSTRTQGSSSGFGGYSSSRRSGVPFRGASTNTRLFSSAYGGNSRLRIRPSSSLPFDGPSNTGIYTTLSPDSEEEGVTQKYDSNEETDVTTENSRRNNNPLLRFRRPQVSRPPFQPGQRNTPANQASTRRPTQQKPKANSPNNITTTIRPRPRAFQRPAIGQVQNRSRPQSSLFPPRRLFQPQNINQALDEEQKTGDDFDDNENEENNSAEYENDTDLDENDAEDSNRRRRESFSKLLSKKRSKRQADSNTRSNFRNRFRRPTTSKPSTGDHAEEFVEEEPSTVRSRTTSRFSPRSHSLSTSTHSSSKLQPNSRAIRPTKPNSNNRAQFTLREKDTTPKLPSRPSSNFRRPTPNGISSRRTTTAASRPKAPRLKSYGNTVTESSHTSPRGRSSTSRTRATTRGRNRNDITTDAIIPVFDGTITVTHISPTEITIPVVNGKVTEYKNIVTTTTSTEVLIPNQYTTLTGQNGASTLILNREETSINVNGATEVTQFVLQESLTSTVIFTPTTIRGRKTSFAHVIPSTVYQVENIVSTMQANIAASAPLANILLSQLLLGNIGLNQPNINPLLALGGTQAISQPPATPTTEYKTRTSTYVTTVTNGMSTVIPLTFHGKEILTTIFDSSSNVITATEYFTDTIVVTPTQQANAQQVNSLLLPLLLQQQLQGQSQIQPSLPVQHSLPTQILLSDNLQELDSNGIQKYNDYNQDIDEYTNSQDESVPVSQDGSKSNGRKNGRRFNKQQPSPTSAFESSVITLYVSGRRPGEFSTVLSTIQLGGDSSLYKRQINRAYNQPVLKSESADFEDFYRSDGSEIQEYLLPAANEITTSQAVGNNFLSEKTQSLESIVGDVDLWYAETSAQLENPTSGSQSTTFEALKKPDINTNRHHLQQNIHTMNAMFPSQHETRSTHFSSISNTESTDNGRFFQLDSYDDGLTINPDGPYPVEGVTFDDATAAADEARYNLATRVMSNGVEVIIAGDKSGKGQHKTNALRILPSLSNKPMTLAPSTLKDQMILIMPSNAQENYTISINSNNFITKTCLTTYTYRTTYLQDGMTTVESREKVVSNTATEERNYFKISPTGSIGVTLSRTPELAVGVFHTTYTYYNTILDGDLPLVLSSQHILTNTITGPDDYISFLQPSEEATPVLETNTYFSSISLTKTLKESNIEKIVSTSNLLTQVVITESLPPRSTAVMTSYIAFDTDESSIQYESVDDITKQAQRNPNHTVATHFQNNQHDQLYLHTKSNSNPTDGQVFEKSTLITNAVSTDLASKLHGSFKSDIHIYATKTYLTTFTYLTTLINTHESATPSTLVNFHTRVIENVITESIPSYLIKSDLLAKFEKNLKISQNRESYVTMVTLPGGQSLEITAINILHTSSTEKKLDSTSTLKPNVTLPNTTVFSALTDHEDLNGAIDSDTASSENDEQFISNQSHTNVQNNNTKTSDITSFPSVNQLIETFNFNRLQALGPVFNAMAGLIQNNFGSPALSNDLKKNITAVDVESKHSTKNITAYDNTQSHEGPIYIPVQNLQSNNHYENIGDLKVKGHINPQHLHISPPQADWFKNENQNHGKIEHNLRKPAYETPLLNGGIPISPGEVITANSDVIIGKPNGIQPRIPYSESNSDVGNALLPPPLPMPHLSFSPHSHQQLKQTKAIPRPIPLESNYDKETNFDGVLKPPPLKPPYLQQKPQFPHNMLNHNYRLNYAGEHMHQAQRQHHPQYQPQHQSQHQLQAHHSTIMHQHIPLQNTYNKEINQKPSSSQVHKRIVSPKPNYISYRPHDYDSQPQLDNKSETDLNKELYNNEILEIRRIPEVYSTDLPGRESMVVNSSTTFKNGNFKTLIKKVVDSNQPMLVDIKPSQITNIVIPRDNSASILIVESAVELHKNGQYYDEPAIYMDGTDTDNGRHTPSVRKPISSNQQVNLDTNVLSHNIDINVPPITFNKDTDFPHSTPVRGQIHRKEVSNFHMPHITIPLTDNQIQVNLTPQNTLTQKIVGTFFHNIDPVNGRDNGIKESLKNIDPVRSPSPISPISNITENKKKYFNRISTNVSQSGIKQKTYSTPATSEIRRPINTAVFVSTPQYNQQTPVLNSNFKHKNVSETYFSETSVSHRPTYYFALREDSLKLSQNNSTTKPIKIDEFKPRPTFNPAPLLHLFYGLKDTAENEDLKVVPEHDVDYWEKDLIDDEDEDATEDSNKMEDQKVSSSINIVIPLQNKIKKNELAKSEMDQSEKHTITNKSDSKNLNSNATYNSTNKSKTKFSTDSPPNTQQTDKVDYRSPLVGSESFLDSSSVNAVNNMGELGTEIPSPYSPPMFIPTGGRPIPIGKPFSKPKTTLTSPQNIKNQQSISINMGEGFKLHNEGDKTPTTPPQMPSAADTIEFENRERTKNTQTENPFNMKFNKNVKKPSSLKTSLPIIRPQLPPTKTMLSSKNLNKMEFVNQLNTNRSNYRVRDSAEIFDSYESMNPHNHNYVKLANNETTTFRNTPQQNMALTPSVPSLDIKPPPIPVIAASENVVGLNPPPPRTTPLPRPPISTPVHIPLFVPTVLSNKRTNTTNRKTIIKHSYTTNRPVKLSTLSTKVGSPSYSRSTLRSKQMTIVNSKVRSSPTSKIYATPSSSISRTASTVGYITPAMDSIPSSILMSSKVLSSTKQNNQLTSSTATSKIGTVRSELVLSVSTPETVDADKNTIIYDTESQENPILTLNQQIPDEILIEGSEIDQRRKLSITPFENHTIIYQEPPIVTENPSRIPETPTFRKSTRKRIIIPTKYVTNTHIITITTTKTSVITSHGIPSTQTLTLTKTQTSTLVDTVTETHTLLKPTKIKEGLEMSSTKTLPTGQYSVSDNQTTESTSHVHEIQTIDNIHHDKTHPMIDSVNPITTPNTNQDQENNSIFVVMTDKKNNGGVFSIIPSMIDTPHNINAIGNENDNSIGLDYDENITFNLPTRDEEVGINEVNHVLLGGVLIATPPKANENSHLDEVSTQCRPSCKASRNELCQMIDNRMGCSCRPGFARMFPDRPCRPTYTYAMQIPIHRISKQALHFKEQYRMKDSDDFKQLARITHDAVDRMIMQSDLRDVYHGVHVTSFDTSNSESGILGKFLIQLSDNSDEKRLVDVFKKYLRQNNFSLGGTEIFTTKNGVNSLEIIDFNECAHSQFHDCSENSRCFNLQGTYTCSCHEGYVDLSENSIYPGRICSAEIVGCERCHYHGKCVQEDKNTYPICECFHWYTGASCQVNLKILLIALVTVGTILFIMLLICVLLTCTRKKKNHNMQSLMSGIHIIAPRNSRLSKHQTPDKRAMIKDSSSETSQNSLPYSVKDSKKQKLFTNKIQSIQQPTHQQQSHYRNINQRGQPSLALISTLSEIDRRHNFTEQNDRSLTVMIPRAKYHHSLSAQCNTDDIGRTTPNNEVQILAVPLETETKSSSYQCNREKNQKAIALSKKTSPNIANHGALHTSSTGALVSAGFEVSATVGNIISEKKTATDITSQESGSNELFRLADEAHIHNKNYQDQYSQYNTYKDEEKFIDSMDVWLDTIQQNELTAEARSFDETTIQAPTKSLRSVFDRQIAQNNTNDEANTMAERDIGSTFLLPHTHLYKPDRDSDVSGFDSI